MNELLQNINEVIEEITNRTSLVVDGIKIKQLRKVIIDFIDDKNLKKYRYEYKVAMFSCNLSLVAYYEIKFTF